MAKNPKANHPAVPRPRNPAQAYPGIRSTSKTHRRILSTSKTYAAIDPVTVQKALGATAPEFHLAAAWAGSLSISRIREDLLKRLRSSGGRPALTGTTQRKKIPLPQSHWKLLEEIAAAVAGPNFSPSPGQIASVLLAHVLHGLRPELRADKKRDSQGRAKRGDTA